MNTSLEGTALITGASSGIGAVYADRLARRGYDRRRRPVRRDRLRGAADHAEAQLPIGGELSSFAGATGGR